MSIETIPPSKTSLDADKVIYREKCIVLNIYMTKEKSELGCRLLTVRYFVMMWELLFISEKLQSVITTEINGCLSLFSARDLFLAKFKFLLLEHHDQLKDHEGMKTIRRFIQQA